MRVLATYPFLTLYLHPAPWPTLETCWQGFVGSTDFRQALTQAVALAQEHGVRGWVADDRRLGAVRPKDLDWNQRHVLQALDALGLERFALLESADALNRLTIERMYDQAQSVVSFALRRFTDLAEARAWASGA